jgi:hypothetical protein
MSLASRSLRWRHCLAGYARFRARRASDGQRPEQATEPRAHAAGGQGGTGIVAQELEPLGGEPPAPLCVHRLHRDTSFDVEYLEVE